MTATIHLRARKGGPLCGERGPTLPVTAIEVYARRPRSRCPACWRIVLDHLYAIEPPVPEYRRRP